jgi:hypothetical protein
MRRSKVGLLAVALCLTATSSLSTESAQAIAKRSSLPCSNVTMLDDTQSMGALAPSTQAAILAALKPSILSFAQATAENLEEDLRLHKIKLGAVLVSRIGESHAVYVIHWRLPEFGVNGAVWIVEVNSHGTRNLVAPEDGVGAGDGIGAGSFSGWGMQVLSRRDKHYPEIMFADGKGFAQDGISGAVVVCKRKVGGFYKSVPCPTHCLKNLDWR